MSILSYPQITQILQKESRWIALTDAMAIVTWFLPQSGSGLQPRVAANSGYPGSFSKTTPNRNAVASALGVH